jgi:hypothetical protein
VVVVVVVVVSATGVQSAQVVVVVSSPRRYTAAPRLEPTRPSTTKDFMLIDRVSNSTLIGLQDKAKGIRRALAKELYAKRKSDPRWLAERVVGKRT